MDLPLENIQLAARDSQPALVDFTQHIVATPSLPGEEGDVADIIHNEMVNLGFDEVWRDQVGNIIGKVEGGDGPTILLNGHMDHVDTGPPDGWPYPPFSGQIVDGELWGRASVDMKGPVACMIYATSLFHRLGLRPHGDIYMTVPVMEEIGGLGTQHLITHLSAHAAICGEPSSNTLRRGHRGRVELRVTFEGHSAHASAPHLGVNPHYGAAAFLTHLPDLTMAYDATLGLSTVVPTLYATDQLSPNVIPGRVYLTLDWRNIAGETPEDIVAKVENLAASIESLNQKVTVVIKSQEFTTYTGITQEIPALFPSYLLPQDDRFVQAAHQALVTALGRDDGLDIWRFATDGGHLMTADIPTVGFGPGDEKLAHTNQERISLAQMEEAVVGYFALITALAEAV
ncbi:MAG: M20/M25/M40 family metallo-hydrolase [Anaerolineales bacterium]|nr:M20/M25/M40 family metallo-hydrolase [Anaerolineales bacterium]